MPFVEPTTSVVRRPSSNAVLLVLLLAGGTLLGMELFHGWFGYDEGALGQSAARVLSGQVPHRDFDEIYTGLLTYYHAALFSVFGVGLIVMRVALFVASMTWLGAMYLISRRFMPPVGAALVSLAAFAWGVPNYTAAMPSWYILFAATFATLALIRWHETGHQRWLVVAGAASGLAFLFKLPGIFVFLGAGLAILATGDAALATVDAAAERVDERASRLPGPPEWAVIAALGLMLLLLARVLGAGGAREVVRYVIPTALLALAIAIRTASPRPAPVPKRWESLATRLLPFLLGGLLPIGAYLAFYASVGGMHELLEGVFVTPFRRLDFAAVRPPPVASLLFALPLPLLFWLSPRAARKWVSVSLVVIVSLAVVVLSASDDRVYRAAWLSAWGLLFFVAIHAALEVVRARSAPRDARANASVTVASVAVGLALIEYPYAPAMYTLYALPLAMLATAAAFRAHPRASVPMQLSVVGFFLAFGLLRIVPGTIQHLGLSFERSGDLAPLELDRGGLWIDPYEAVVYERLIPLVVQLADGRRMWAGPDAPEVYFLAGQPNHTRSLFDFLDADSTRADAFADRLDSLDVSVVVVKLQPPFSSPLPGATVTDLRREFEHEIDVPGFIVMWR